MNVNLLKQFLLTFRDIQNLHIQTLDLTLKIQEWNTESLFYHTKNVKMQVKRKYHFSNQ